MHLHVSSFVLQSLAGDSGAGPLAALPAGAEGRGCGGSDASLWTERTFTPTCVSVYRNPSRPRSPATDRPAPPGTLDRHVHLSVDAERVNQLCSPSCWRRVAFQGMMEVTV